MKKVLLVIGFHFLLGTLFLLQGCSCSEVQIVGGTNFAILDAETETVIEPNDTVSASFVVAQYFDFKNVFYQEGSSVGLNTAYATQPCYRYVNPILDESLELSFSKEFVLEGQPVPANTNLFDNPLVVPYLVPFFDDAGTFLNYFMRVGFTDDFFANAVFPVEEMTIRFTASTEDNVMLENEQAVFLNIQ